MTREQMIFAVAKQEVVDAIGEDEARAIFYYLLNKKRPNMQVFVNVANLSNVIGYDNAEEIFNMLMSF